MQILRYHTDPTNPGKLIGDDEETRKYLATMESATPIYRVSESKRTDIRESKTLGWVKVPIPTETEQSVVRSFILLGLSESEARFAATGRVDITDDYHSVTALQALLGRR
jgi:hypothetical protein